MSLGQIYGFEGPVPTSGLGIRPKENASTMDRNFDRLFSNCIALTAKVRLLRLGWHCSYFAKTSKKAMRFTCLANTQSSGRDTGAPVESHKLRMALPRTTVCFGETRHRHSLEHSRQRSQGAGSI